ncbi:MAG: hypothetical protein Q7N50_15715 [Armatimonadota bacterium]|nr:hypothetical protein [Armatimonadota bacterium]
MNDLFTWESLLTLAGAGAATRYIVALAREVFQIRGRASHLAAFMVAEIVTIGAGLATGAQSATEITLLALNGFLVAGFAIGLNENLKAQG